MWVAWAANCIPLPQAQSTIIPLPRADLLTILERVSAICQGVASGFPCSAWKKIIFSAEVLSGADSLKEDESTSEGIRTLCKIISPC